MRRNLVPSVVLLAIVLGSQSMAGEPSPLEPFQPDEHTLLLYHFDEGQGTVAKDASRWGHDGQIRGATWSQGKFGSALEFDGKGASVVREVTEAIQGLRAITVECWFLQQNFEGRQFLLGKDGTIHFDLSGGASSSISLYHSGNKPSPEGLRHQQVGGPIGFPRAGRWHHLAATYDGHQVSLFLDGVLKNRKPAPRDFSLGSRTGGLWIGSYLGRDYWFAGKIDEVRVSDCVRYDPQAKLAVGGHVFELPAKTLPTKAVRTPKQTGESKLRLAITKSFGGNAAGWVYLKPPARKAVIVGKFDLSKTKDSSALEFDVSDEFLGDGLYLVGLENTVGGYYTVTAAELLVRGQPVSRWAGHANSRRTFDPPVLVPLIVGKRPPSAGPSRIVLASDAADRVSGAIEIDAAEPGSPASLTGTGLAEYWLDLPAEQTYRVCLRYQAVRKSPCDIVIDGRDLNDYAMCARHRTGTVAVRDALWEYQGTVTLSAGPHWIRLQDVLPEIYALRLEPTAPVAKLSVPWERYAVPSEDFLGQAGTWQAEPLFGSPRAASVTLDRAVTPSALRFAAKLANTDPANLSAGDAVRLVHRGMWDLEPFGRLRFQLLGQNSLHALSLWAIDVKGEEKLLWQGRDDRSGARLVSVPVSFEGNEVFDPAHVTAICLDLDEGNVRASQVNGFSGAIVGPVFDRRDALVLPDTYAASLAAASTPLDAARKAHPSAESLHARAFRPWTKPVVPEEHPLYATTEPKPVTRKTMGDHLHQTGARGIDPATLDQYHKHYDFGDVCWPHIGICPLRKSFAKEEQYQAALAAMEKKLQEVHTRGLYLFDIWGYVPPGPGENPEMTKFPWTIAPEHHAVLMKVFGDRFLGYDNGEQDGRYIGSRAHLGKATNRKEGWDDFVAWDRDIICRDAMNYMNATGSVNFSLYYGERGCRMLGLETAQGLPSDTLLFAFLRGAGRQYGRLTYQATSVWNRFGWNVFAERKTDGAEGYGFGPNKGCSLSLHKRLFFCGYLDGHSIFGTESSQFTRDQAAEGVPELSPLGQQHLELGQWAKKHTDRGVLATPVAMMLDFYNGWNMPRHLYRGDKYKIWGKFPYEKGDYQIDAVFRMIWPGYEDASYLRNERGFVTSTPFGDMFDVINTRCHADVLKQYPAVMLLGDVEITPELAAKLTAYVRAGGDLILDAASVRALPDGFCGVRAGIKATACTSCLLASGQKFDELPYSYTVLEPSGAKTLAVNEAGHPLATAHPVEQGRVITIAAEYGLTDRLTHRHPEIVNMEPPYRLLEGVRTLLAGYFDSFNPIEIQPAGLNLHTCCYANDPKRLLVGLINNDLFAVWRGSFHVRLGPVASLRELRTERPLPLGDRTELEIPAGDVVILDVRLK